jgi:hypothetical protein
MIFDEVGGADEGLPTFVLVTHTVFIMLCIITLCFFVIFYLNIVETL